MALGFISISIVFNAAQRKVRAERKKASGIRVQYMNALRVGECAGVAGASARPGDWFPPSSRQDFEEWVE